MNKTYKTYLAQCQKLNRLEKNLAQERERQRKQDTRNKIQLGGLVIKAGLSDLKKSEILGALLDAKQRLHQDSENTLRAWANRGADAFREGSKGRSRED